MSVTRIHIPAGHPAFAGHFPGRPLLPGVAILAEVLEVVLDDPALAGLVGPQPCLGATKFTAPVGPGATLEVRFETTPSALRFEVRNGARLAAHGHFERAAP